MENEGERKERKEEEEEEEKTEVLFSLVFDSPAGGRKRETQWEMRKWPNTLV